MGSGTPEAVRLQDAAEAELAAQVPLVQVRVAREDAAAAEAALDRAMQTSNPADIAEYNEIAVRHATDQAFQIEFVKAVGVKKIGEFGEYLRAHGEQFEPPNTDENLRAQTVKNIGTSLVRAGNPAYDGDLPGFYAADARQWRPGYYDELKAQGRAKFTTEVLGNLGVPQKVPMSGYQTLGEYFYAAGEDGVKPGTAMALDVGVDMVAWERETLASDDQWGMARKDPYLAPTSIVGGDTPASVDALAGWLGLVKNDHRAAQQFLLHKYEDGDGKKQSELKYLMDPQRAEGLPTQLDPNYGQQLGEAIYAGDGNSTDQQSTELAQVALTLYADHVGKKSQKEIEWSSFAEKKGYKRTSGESTYGDEHPGLRKPLAITMAHHIGDFQMYDSKAGQSGAGADLMKGEETWKSHDAQGLYHVSLTRDQFKAVLKDFAADRPDDLKELNAGNPNALQVVIGAQLAFGGMEMQQVANGSFFRR